MLKFIKGIVFTRVRGPLPDLRVVDRILSIESDSEEAEEGDGRLHLLKDEQFYTGLLDRVINQLPPNVGYEISDSPEVLERKQLVSRSSELQAPEDLLSSLVLRDYQIMSIEKAVRNQRGILHMATGSGKTAVLAGIVRLLQLPTVMVVGTVRLLEQTYEAFVKYGLKKVGRVGGGYFDPAEITIGVSDTLSAAARDTEADLFPYIDAAQVLIFDECHHAPAYSWTVIGETCRAVYRYGASGTPVASYVAPDYRDLCLIGLTGERIVFVPSYYLQDQGYLARPVISMVPVVNRIFAPRYDWSKIYKRGIVGNKHRNNLVCDIASQMYSQGHKVLIIVKEIKHGDHLLVGLHSRSTPASFAYGADVVRTYDGAESFEEDHETMESLLHRVERSDRICLVASPIMDEGIDLPSVTCLIIAAGGKSPIKTIQRIGRGLRRKEGDNVVYVFDFLDHSHFVLGHHSRKRKTSYLEEKFEVYEGLGHLNSLLEHPIEIRSTPRITDIVG